MNCIFITLYGVLSGKINCCTFAARDDILFTGCYDKLVRAFDVRAYQHNKPIQCMAEARDTISR